MGILNVTPDSFSDGGHFLEASTAVNRAWQIAEEGADFLDIGGESSRPGSSGVSADEEMSRVLPVLERLSGKYPLPISIDTSKAAVARAALERGAALVNDITSLRNDPAIAAEAASFGAALVLMHMRGTPATMQALPPSPDILREIELWAEEAVARARSSGVSSDKIILDPGIGFGKTVGQNLEILRNLDRLAAAGFPILVGTSRKSFIGAILKNAEPDRIWGTGATVALSIASGAHIVRVHDVAAMRDVARVADALITAAADIQEAWPHK
jgi:dihydropteroate synthase